MQPFAALVRAYPGRLGMLLAIPFFGAMGGNAAGLLLPKFLQEVHGYSAERKSRANSLLAISLGPSANRPTCCGNHVLGKNP